MASGTYNYVLKADNDTGTKLVAFVNGSTRSFDGGVSNVTIRNDGGSLILGTDPYPTILYGNVGIGKTNPATALDVTGTVTATTMTASSIGFNAVPAVATRSTQRFYVYDPSFCIELMQRSSSIFGLNFITRNTDGVFSWRKVANGGTDWGTELLFLDNSGNLTAVGNITSSSDRRIKKDIKRIQGALYKVTQISGYTFTRTDESSKGMRQAGVIAQEILEVLPEVVQKSEETGYYSVSYGNITALLIEALKEERLERLKLEERLARLEKLNP